MALETIVFADFAASRLAGGWRRRAAAATAAGERCTPFPEAWAAHRSKEPALRDPHELSRIMRRGVPPEMRSSVWSRCLEESSYASADDGHPGAEAGGAASSTARADSASGEQPGGSEQAADAEEVPKWVSQLIETDVPRTFGDSAAFQETGGPEKLRRALRRFALENPDIGYCQSLNFVAAVLVMVMQSQEAVPLMMGRLLGKLGARQWYTEGMQQLRADAAVFRDLIRKRMPIINGALHTHDFDPLFICPRWFLSLFSTVLQGEALLRVWDAVMADGAEAVFRVAMALLAWREDDLVRAHSQEELLELLLMRRCEVDADELMAIAYHPELLGPTAGSELGELRRAASGRVASSDEASPGGAAEAVRALAPYLLAHYARDLMATGREARGGDAADDYHFGDLSRGLLASARRFVGGSGEGGSYRFGDITRGLVSRLTTRTGDAPAAAAEPAAAAQGGGEAAMERLIGTWRYSAESCSFQITEVTPGLLRYEEELSSKAWVSATLQLEGLWQVGEVYCSSGEPLGAVRLRFAEDLGAVVLSRRDPGAAEWGAELVASEA